MRHLSFKRHRFPPDVITSSIWLYARFTLSPRDVEEMFAERGLDVSYETVRRWFLKFGSIIAANLKRGAAKLIKKLLKRYGIRPSRIVTDKLRSYRAACRCLGLTGVHDQRPESQQPR